MERMSMFGNANVGCFGDFKSFNGTDLKDGETDRVNKSLGFVRIKIAKKGSAISWYKDYLGWEFWAKAKADTGNVYVYTNTGNEVGSVMKGDFSIVK